MKRSMFEKYQSTKLHQSWFIILAALVLLLEGYISMEIWLGATMGGFGGHLWSNLQQHKLYGNASPPAGTTVVIDQPTRTGPAAIAQSGGMTDDP